MAWWVRSPFESVSSVIGFDPEMNERSFLFYNFSPICQVDWPLGQGNLLIINERDGSGGRIEAICPRLEESVRKHLKYNITVNLLDGAFYGLGWGFGSLGPLSPFSSAG